MSSSSYWLEFMVCFREVKSDRGTFSSKKFWQESAGEGVALCKLIDRSEESRTLITDDIELLEREEWSKVEE